jgi:hypothetical protein
MIFFCLSFLIGEMTTFSPGWLLLRKSSRPDVSVTLGGGDGGTGESVEDDGGTSVSLDDGDEELAACEGTLVQNRIASRPISLGAGAIVKDFVEWAVGTCFTIISSMKKKKK